MIFSHEVRQRLVRENFTVEFLAANLPLFLRDYDVKPLKPSAWSRFAYLTLRLEQYRRDPVRFISDFWWVYALFGVLVAVWLVYQFSSLA